jgi:uncharacterized protein (UPF0332 family)
MMDEERIEEAKRNARTYIRDGLLKIGDKDVKRFAGFYLSNAETSLQTASILFQLSANERQKDLLNININFESYLWVIVSSYYSMFYTANALLSNEGIKIGGEIVHKVTADALINFFIANSKLAKLLEDYEEAKNEALELIGKEETLKINEEKAKELILSYEFERRKRSKFQYDIGVSAKQNYAKTSLERAKRFFFEIKKLIAEK